MGHSFQSPTDIANMALSHIGATSTIASLDEKSAAARQANIWYDYSRLQVLEAYNWGFARKRLTLALHADEISETSTDPLAGVWGYRYQYPEDAVKIRKIQNSNAPPDDAVPFAIETNLDGTQKTILCDLQDAVAVYTRDLTSSDLFSAGFVIALSHMLAHQIAFSITGKRSIRLDELQEYRLVLGEAAAADANESVEGPPRDADWVRGRT